MVGLAIGAAVSLRMPRSCDKGLKLWGRAPTYPEGSEIRRPRCEASGVHVGQAAPNGGFRPSGLNYLSLEFARAEGPKNLTSECVVLCFRRGVATAASLFVGICSFLLDWGRRRGCPDLCGLCWASCTIAAPDRVLSLLWRVPLGGWALLKPNVSYLGAYRCMLSVIGLCSGEGPICPELPLYLGGDARVEVEWFVQLSLSPASWGVPIRRTPPPLKYEERVREEFSGRCETMYRSLPVTGVSM
ncbi:hypothetical protein CRG98_034306 [Punica granatum]|uniref:Uncharacterized protein n=1 Tax=Punica granatum TaxID=22663 RepID=A0A2I0IPF1_PUNGR|nr:hypothetical protein CRG98_034306 [Punica granatum]